MKTYYPKNLNYKPKGRRNIGRPQTRWEDDFREEGTGLIVDDDDDDDDDDDKYPFDLSNPKVQCRVHNLLFNAYLKYINMFSNIP
jgi:hypothetical protein